MSAPSGATGGVLPESESLSVVGTFGALPKAAYTRWVTRVAAYLIDFGLLAVVGVIAAAALKFTEESNCRGQSGDLGPGSACPSEPSTLGLILALVCVFAGVVLFIWNFGYRQGTTGSSVGKSVMKFKVVSQTTGQPIGFGSSILRQFLHLLDGMLGNLGYLWPLWDAKRQTFADKIMSTVCLPI